LVDHQRHGVGHLEVQNTVIGCQLEDSEDGIERAYALPLRRGGTGLEHGRIGRRCIHGRAAGLCMGLQAGKRCENYNKGAKVFHGESVWKADWERHWGLVASLAAW
jgi:hypothetical protein